MIAARNVLNSTFGLLLALAALAGLLNFPTTCACGAALPHEHSLFLIRDHHHAGEASSGREQRRASSSRVPSDDHKHDHASDHEHGQAHDFGQQRNNTTTFQVDAETLRVSAPETTRTFGEQIALMYVAVIRAAATGGAPDGIASSLAPRGQAVRPEPPPPQA